MVWAVAMTQIEASAGASPCCALFAGVVELRQAPVYQPQLLLLVINHHLQEATGVAPQGMLCGWMSVISGKPVVMQRRRPSEMQLTL